MIERTLFLTTATLLFAACVAGTAGAVTPEAGCQAARWTAVGKYNLCQETVFARTNLDIPTSNGSMKCVGKYAAVAAMLQEHFPSTSCATARFVDNGDGTVTDNLTALQWERKDNFDGTPNLADPHDADNLYTWSPKGGTAAMGSVYTDFLAKLNGACFAGQCDWRLPTITELQTILATPCSTRSLTACIDSTFGPTAFSKENWSSTSVQGEPSLAWSMSFLDGGVFQTTKSHHKFAGLVRAVRGGL